MNTIDFNNKLVAESSITNPVQPSCKCQNFRLLDLADELALHVFSFSHSKELIGTIAVSKKYNYLQGIQFKRNKKAVLEQFERALYALVPKADHAEDDHKTTAGNLNPLKELGYSINPMVDLIDYHRSKDQYLLSPLRRIVEWITKINFKDCNDGQSIYSEIFIKREILTHCILQNSITIAKILVIWGKNINVPQTIFNTALFYAVRKESKEIVEFLLNHGAVPTDMSYISILNEFYHYINVGSPSHITSLQRIEIFQMLIRSGAVLNTDSWDRDTNILTYAVEKGACLEAIFLGAKQPIGRYTNIHVFNRWSGPTLRYRETMALLLNNSPKLNPHYIALGVGYNCNKNRLIESATTNFETIHFEHEFIGEPIKEVIPKIEALVEMRNSIALTVLGVFQMLEETHSVFNHDISNLTLSYLDPYVDDINDTSYLQAQHKIMHLFFRAYLKKYTQISID